MHFPRKNSPEGLLGFVAEVVAPQRKLCEGGIALQGLSERHATLGAEVVVAEAAHTAKAG